MSVNYISGEDLKNLDRLFEGWNDTLIWSCLQGYMGSAWADNSIDPKSAQIAIADFCFLAGEPNIELVKYKPLKYNSDFVIMVPQDKEWAKLIEEVYLENAVRVARYAIKKEFDVFNVKKLEKMVENASRDFDIRLIDKEIYDMAMEQEWSRDLCSQFENYEQYSAKGLGVAAMHNGELVSGASSYTVYRDGIEIEIDTRADYRRKGLALVCGAKLILECINRNLYPSWDAQNKWSVGLAEKLGYHFDKEYVAYEVNSYGNYMH